MRFRVVARNDKRIGCSPPYPSPSWGGYLANPLPKLRGNRQNAPSPDWGRHRMHLPLIGEGRDGECPVRAFFRHSAWLFGRAMVSESKPVRWKTMSFPTTRIIQIRHGVPCINRQCVTPCLTRSPLRVQNVLKQIVQLCDSESALHTGSPVLTSLRRFAL